MSFATAAFIALAPCVPAARAAPVGGREVSNRMPTRTLVAGVQAADPGIAANVVIHEMLHTLGLEENPPTSEEITRQVVKRCGP